MPDEEVLKWAVKEGRPIITTDNDFEELILDCNFILSDASCVFLW